MRTKRPALPLCLVPDILIYYNVVPIVLVLRGLGDRLNQRWCHPQEPSGSSDGNELSDVISVRDICAL